MTLTLDSSVTASYPAQFTCSTGGGPANASVSLSLNGPVSLSLSDSACTHPANRTLTATFHGLAGQTYTFQVVLGVSANGLADLVMVSGSTAISVSSSADASHTGIFKLDPATPGAAYTTESGVSYASIVPNQPPVANAGSDQTVPLGATVTLDGSGSADPDTPQCNTDRHVIIDQ